MTSKNWRTDHTGTHHINGIKFDRAPLPGRWHRCRPWTIGQGPYGAIYRCACGSLRIQGSRRWRGKNCRRREHKGGGPATLVPTTSGEVELTDDILDRLADEAEKGYDISRLRRRNPSGPAGTNGPA